MLNRDADSHISREAEDLDSNSPFSGDSLLAAGAVILVAYVWWRLAWVSDDAYATFRAIEVWFAGNGPNFNPGQRVAGATSPLWFLLLSAGRLFYGDPYWVALALSAAFTALALYFGWRVLLDPLGWILLVLLFVGSRALIDYSSSGLETPLCYALLAAFLWRYSRLFDGEPTERRFWSVGVIGGLLLIARYDLLLLIGPSLAWVLIRFRSALPATRWASLIAASAAPFLLWTAFSVFYYGTLVPTATLSKLSYSTYGDRGEVLTQGLKNLQVIAYDPISMLVLVAGLATCFRRGAHNFPYALGLLFYLGVFAYHGGDWMDARIFTPILIVFLPSAAYELRSVARAYLLPAVVAGATLCFLWPDYPWDSAGPIVDHRESMKGWNEFYRGASGQNETARYLCPDWRRMEEADLLTTMTRMRAAVIVSPRIEPHFVGRQYACGVFSRGTDISIAGVYFTALGLFSYFSGPKKFIVEDMLVDPLVTRLPPKYQGRYLHYTGYDFRPGHIRHDLPDGYIESILSGENEIEDPAVARLYDDVKLATQGPLMASGRFAAIWRLNTGYDYGTDAGWRAVWEHSKP